MKKFFAVVLTLILALTACCASAQTVSFAFTAAVDAEGNLIDVDTSDLEKRILTIDDEEYTIAVEDIEDTEGTETIFGTLEMTETEDGVFLTATLETDVELTLVYAVTEDGVRTLTIVRDNGMLLVYTEI